MAASAALPLSLTYSGEFGRFHTAMEWNVYVNSLFVFVVALAGGLWALIGRLSTESLHLALSLSAGFFLGAVFLELLPLSFSQSLIDARTIGALTLLGFALMYIVEKGISSRADAGIDKDSHRIVALTAGLGLSLHSVVEGAALSLGGVSRAASAFILPILLHKAIASLALGSLFLLAGCTRRRIALYITLFALMTPLGALLTTTLVPLGELSSRGHFFGSVTAFTAGVFLYVATADILPEVMHSRASIGWKLALLSGGMLIMWGVGAPG
ncbi:MAG: ZIP family metal transporter [Candidatus Zixiibacteriota bacterium]